MGKNNKQNPVAAATQKLDENNIEGITNNQLMAETTVAKAMDELTKDKEEADVRLIKRRIKHTQWDVGEALLQQKRQKKMIDLSLLKVRQATRALRFLTGTVVDEATLEYAKTPDTIWKKETLSKDGKSIELTLPDGKKQTFKVGDTMPPIFDPVDFDGCHDSIESLIREETKKIDEWYTQQHRKLELSFGDYYDRSWRW